MTDSDDDDSSFVVIESEDGPPDPSVAAISADFNMISLGSILTGPETVEASPVSNQQEQMTPEETVEPPNAVSQLQPPAVDTAGLREDTDTVGKMSEAHSNLESIQFGETYCSLPDCLFYP